MKQLIIMLLLFALPGAASGGDLLKIRNGIKDIKTTLYNNSIPSAELLEGIQSELEDSLLKEKLKIMSDIAYSRDTMLSLINTFSDEFYKLHGSEMYSRIQQSGKSRFVLFITTLSCECTINMCRDYEEAMYRILAKNNDYDFVIIDSFTDGAITDAFDISFVPVLIIQDESGKEVTRFTREENISEKLKNYFNNGGQI
jgi:hypothetical protein